jgi:hypothetical protein
LRIDERPTVELRDWMYNDILLTLWESRPKFESIREEGADVETERAAIDEATGLPVIETIDRGILKLNLLSWLKKSPAKPVYNSS